MSQDVAMTNQLLVSMIDETENMSRPLQQRHEARSLLKQLSETFALIGDLLLRVDTRSRLAHDAQDAADAAIRLSHGRIGNIKIDVLAHAVPFDVERPVFCRKCLPAGAHAAQERFEVVPQLRPVFAGGTAERARMLVANRRRIGIVVERNIVRTPNQDDFGPGGKDQSKRRTKRRRPALWRP